MKLSEQSVIVRRQYLNSFHFFFFFRRGTVRELTHQISKLSVFLKWNRIFFFTSSQLNLLFLKRKQLLGKMKYTVSSMRSKRPHHWVWSIPIAFLLVEGIFYLKGMKIFFLNQMSTYGPLLRPFQGMNP